MISNDIYRPPVAEPQHSTFSREEWIYVLRTFAAWLIGMSILTAIVFTAQMHFALSQFGGEIYVGRVVALQVFDGHGPGLVMASACNTLAMVTERRAKRANLRPVQLPWSLVVILGLAVPLAMSITVAVSSSLVTFAFDIPWSDSWTGIESSIQWRSLVTSLLAVVTAAVVLIAYVQPTMRLLLRFRGWLILKFIIMSQAMGLLLYLVRWTGNFILSR